MGRSVFAAIFKPANGWTRELLPRRFWLAETVNTFLLGVYKRFEIQQAAACLTGDVFLNILNSVKTHCKQSHFCCYKNVFSWISEGINIRQLYIYKKNHVESIF